MPQTPAALPRDDLFRAVSSGLELRSAGDDDGMPTLVGHFAVFNQWTEINSWYEGNFLERIAPGAFKKTFAENRSNMKVLFQHGMDPQIADKPLGPIDQLSEDRTGGYYEVPLLAADYVRELVPGLEAGLYGASFRFQVMREEIVDEPGVSAYNPKGIQERTIAEAKVIEFGPVTFPAYAEATAGVRSVTDLFRRKLRSAPPLSRADVPSLQALLCAWQALDEFIALEDDADDGPDREKAAAIQAELEELMKTEAAEDEASEDSPDDRAAGRHPGSSRRARNTSDAAPYAHLAARSRRERLAAIEADLTD
jgi:HK97 family phage prohead protease